MITERKAEKFIRENADQVLRECFLVLQDMELAEEAFREVFLRSICKGFADPSVLPVIIDEVLDEMSKT